MTEKGSEKATDKKQATWLILGAVVALVGVVMWLLGRKNKNFSASALKEKLFGGRES